jgi:hypothetical protein
MTSAANQNNKPAPGSLDDLRQRKDRYLAEAAATEDDFDAGLLLFKADMQDRIAAKVWDAKI